MEGKEQAIEKLTLLISKGFKKSEIESDLGMPQNNLAGYISGSRGDLPKKFIQKILDYTPKSKSEIKSMAQEIEDLKRAKQRTFDICKAHINWLREQNKALKKELSDIKSQVIEAANVPRGTNYTERRNKKIATSISPTDVENHTPDKKTQNLPQKNEPAVNIGDMNNDAEIERLTKAMNSCSDTSLGRKAKAHYQRQIDNLKKQ